MLLRGVHWKILLPLFAVLEKHETAPRAHTGIKLGATFVCCGSRVPFTFCFCWRSWGGLGAGGESLCTVWSTFSGNAFQSVTVWHKVLIATYLMLRRLYSSSMVQKQWWPHPSCPLSPFVYPLLPIYRLCWLGRNKEVTNLRVWAAFKIWWANPALLQSFASCVFFNFTSWRHLLPRKIWAEESSFSCLKESILLGKLDSEHTLDFIQDSPLWNLRHV